MPKVIDEFTAFGVEIQISYFVTQATVSRPVQDCVCMFQFKIGDTPYEVRHDDLGRTTPTIETLRRIRIACLVCLGRALERGELDA